LFFSGGSAKSVLQYFIFFPSSNEKEKAERIQKEEIGEKMRESDQGNKKR